MSVWSAWRGLTMMESAVWDQWKEKVSCVTCSQLIELWATSIISCTLRMCIQSFSSRCLVRLLIAKNVLQARQILNYWLFLLMPNCEAKGKLLMPVFPPGYNWQTMQYTVHTDTCVGRACLVLRREDELNLAMNFVTWKNLVTLSLS